MPAPRPKSKPKGPPRPSSPRLDLSDGPVSERSAEDQLAEVENALSLLDGRHPEFVRAEREKVEATQRRRRELEGASARARKRAFRGLLIAGAIAIVVGVCAWLARERYEAGRRALDGSAAAAKTFAALGFSETPRSPWGTADRLEVALTAGTCVVAIGASAGKPIAIDVTHDGNTVEAKGSFGFCTCANETVTITAKSGDAAKRSVRLLQTDARAFGSVLGFARRAPRPTAVARCACTEDQLDGWLEHADDVLGPASPAATKEDPPAYRTLATTGLRVVHTVAASTPLFPLGVEAGGCTVVIANDPGDKLSLRVRGGGLALEAAKGPLAVCSKSARGYGVWHEGPGVVTLMRGEGLRVGGRLGLHWAIERAGVGPVRTWVEPDDLSWDAAVALSSSQIPGAKPMELDAATKLPPDARLLAFSVAPGGRMAPATGAEAACERGDAALLTSVCAQASPQGWRESTGKARVGVAVAPLPIWLKPLANVPEATATLAAVVRLARTLRLQGFDATSLEAVTETAYGASVLGRAGEDAVVALTLQPSPPYALPLSDGPVWSLDGEPAILALAPGRKIALRSRGAPTSSEDVRRTVVFRRAVAAPSK